MTTEYLHCDAEGCDHKETVTEINESLIGKECPKCGANLLTKEDYDLYAPMHAAKKMLQALGVVAPDGYYGDQPVSQVSVRAHKGKVTIQKAGDSDDY